MTSHRDLQEQKRLKKIFFTGKQWLFVTSSVAVANVEKKKFRKRNR